MADDWKSKQANRMQGVQPSAIRELLRLGADPSVISFGGGYPDPRLFPVRGLREAYLAALADSQDSLQYTVTDGLPRLRAQVAERLSVETPTDTDDVLVLQGAQQGLDLVAKMLIDPGDVIITERPTFVGALIAFAPYEPRIVAVDIDHDGMRVDALAETLAAHPDAKFMYVQPDFHNPTGVSLSLQRRHELLRLSAEYGVVILEDLPYRELRFTESALPTLRSLDSDGRVIQLGSFSKVLAPGMRLGWAAAPAPLIEKLSLLKLAADTQTSTLNMAAAVHYLDAGGLDDHIAGLRAAYRAKRDLMLAAIDEHFPPEVQATVPDGGLFTWLSFPPDIDTAQLLQERVIPMAGVAYVPGSSFFPVRAQHYHARVNYSNASDGDIVEGIRRWAAALPAAGRIP